MVDRTNAEWCIQLSGPAPDAALQHLRSILLRGMHFALISYAVTATDLEDFVQDGLVKILQELPSYRGEARFTTWAQKVCVRVALTELRRRRWRDVSLDELVTSSELADFKPEVITDRGADPVEAATMQIMMAAVQRIIMEELTDLQRAALMAVMQGGMPLQEVADRMGTNRNALYKLLHDARRRVQTRLIKEGMPPQDLLGLFE